MKSKKEQKIKRTKEEAEKYYYEKYYKKKPIVSDNLAEKIGSFVGILLLAFWIFGYDDLQSYRKDRNDLKQLLNQEKEFLIIKDNICKNFALENVAKDNKSAKCDAINILRKRIDGNKFGFLLPDELKQDKSYKITDKLIPIKDKEVNNNLKKTLSSKKEFEETKISGCLEGDCINNFSKKNYSNGHYIGEFKNQKANGQGTFVWDDGDKYIGEWKDGNRTGQGIYIWNDGSKYTGDFLNGERTGKGTMNYSDGGKYTGDFLKGERHGKGTLTWYGGDKYDGDFVNNKRDGEGTYIWTDGDKYFGEFTKNKMTGEGTFISGKDNSTLVGKFVDARITDGFVILPDGFKLRAFKKDGELKFSRVQNSNQNMDLLAKQLKRNNDLQTSRMLLDISKSLMGTRKNSTSLNLNNLNIGGGFLSGSSSSGMYKTCRYSSSLGTKTKTVFSSSPCPMAY